MYSVLGHQIDPDLSGMEWEDTVTSKSFIRGFLQHHPQVVATIDGIDIYMYKVMDEKGLHYHFASFDGNKAVTYPFHPINFYCEVGYNSSRNGLFKKGCGLHTVSIWKNRYDPNLPNKFATKVLYSVILAKYVNKMFVTDKIKSIGGNKIIKSCMKALALRGWHLYIGLSDEEHKYIIPVTYTQYLAKIQTTQGLAKSYRYRCLFALKDDEELKNIILDNTVQVVSFRLAVRLNLFKNPSVFDSKLKRIDEFEQNTYND